jgi:hypothetical protein
MVVTNKANSFQTASEELKFWLKDAKLLKIVDRYFFSSGKKTKINYISKIKKILPDNLEKLNIYYDEESVNTDVIKEVEKYCRKQSIELKNIKANNIHDRVWDKNNREAKVIGTSFNTLGHSVAFILSLSKRDREDFLSALAENLA